MFGSGFALNHPDPIIRHFWNFEMPPELVEGYGYPDLTPQIKAKILGRNLARMHGIDLEDKRVSIANDRWSELRRSEKAAPWSSLRARLQEA